MRNVKIKYKLNVCILNYMKEIGTFYAMDHMLYQIVPLSAVHYFDFSERSS